MDLMIESGRYIIVEPVSANKVDPCKTAEARPHSYTPELYARFCREFPHLAEIAEEMKKRGEIIIKGEQNANWNKTGPAR